MSERIADLVVRLRVGMPGERASTAAALAALGPGALEPLIEVLGSGDWPARAGAAKALGQIGDRRAIDALSSALRLTPWYEDEDEELRVNATEALGLIGGEAVVEPLIGALRGRCAAARCVAAEALGRIGDLRAVPALIDAVREQGFEGDGVREAASGALEAMGGGDALPRKVVAAGGLPPASARSRCGGP